VLSQLHESSLATRATSGHQGNPRFDPDDNPSRTRTISLGIWQIRPSDGPDLGSRCTASDCDAPCDTPANGPPMARDLMVLGAASLAASVILTLAQFTAPEADALVFTSPTGTPLRPSNFRRRSWAKALEAAGLPAIHFHDLRHTGNTLTAEAGANLRELMERMGHRSTRAAMIYLHSTSERQRALADTLGALVATKLKSERADSKASGTEVARHGAEGA